MYTSDVKSVALNALDVLMKQDSLKSEPDFQSQLTYFQNRITDDEFRIAVVGEFSSGKSTFLNAIIGRDILKHGTEETTATITRIVNVAPDDPRNGTGVIIFQNGSTKDLSDFNELQHYTTKKSDQYDVAAEIDTVELYVPILDTDAKVVFVDTPGLNGTAKGHYEKTVELIKQAHACIYLLQLRGLTESDEYFIRSISRFQKNFIFVQNFIDDLKISEGDVLSDKLDAQRRILQERVFSAEDHVHFELCGVSALHALAHRDLHIKRLYCYDIEDIHDAYRAHLWQSSHFEDFLLILDDILQVENRMRIQYGDTATAICQWIDLLLHKMEDQRDSDTALFSRSKESRFVSMLKDFQNTLQNQDAQNENKQELLGHVTRSCRGFYKAELPLLRESLEKALERLTGDINDFRKINNLENWVSRELNLRLKTELTSIYNDHLIRFKSNAQVLNNRVVNKIEQYLKLPDQSVEFSNISIQTPERPDIHFVLEDEVKKSQEIVDSAQEDIDKSKQQLFSIEKERENSQRNLEQTKKEQENRQQAFVSAVNRLGSKPAPTKKQEWYTTQEWRHGLWGDILDGFLGPKTVTKLRWVTDDSNVKEWEEKLAIIKNTHNAEIRKIDIRIKTINKELDTLDRDYKKACCRHSEKEQELSKKLQELKSANNLLAKEKEKAAAEYLKEYKNSIRVQLRNYLLEDETNCILKQILSGMKTGLDQIEAEIQRKAILLYEDARKLKLHKLEEAISQNTPAIQQRINKVSATVDALYQIKKDMEEIIHDQPVQTGA